MKYLKLYSTIALAVALGLASCKKEKEPQPEVEAPGSSSVIISLDVASQGFYPLHYISSAESGTADIVQAQELLKSAGAMMIASKDGYIYVNDGSNFVKLKVGSDGILAQVDDPIPSLGINGSPLHAFLTNDKMIVTSKQLWPANGVYSYQVIDTKTMTEEANSTLTIPVLGNANANYSYMFATDYVVFEGNLYVPFIESDDQDAALYDSASVAVYDASTLQYKKTIHTTKTASLCNGMNPSYGVSESGDLYLSSSNTSMYGGNESVPSGIVRIKKGQTEIDENYFFNITAKTGFHSLGMLYVGNNKAIVQVFNSNVWNTSNYFVEYYLADLTGNSMTKLDIPACNGSKGLYAGGRRSMALLGNGKAAIISNTATESSLYIYDPATGKATKGVTYTGADAITGLKAY